MNSIKVKGMIFSLGLIFFSIFTLGFSAYSGFRTILVDEVNKAVVRVAEESADNLGNYLDQFVSPLLGIAENTDIASMNWEKQKEILSAQINPYYLNIAVVDRDGLAHYTDGNIVDLSDRDYIHECFTGKVTFSDVLISRVTNSPVIMAAVPIMKNQEIQGALVARLDVDFLSKYALSRGYGNDGRAYIISNKGSFISSQDLERTQGNFNLYDMASESNGYLDFSKFVQESHNKNAGFGRYKFKGDNILMGYAPIEGTSWMIFIGTYENETLEALYGLQRVFVVIMTLTTLICSFAALHFVGRFTKPIIELDNLFDCGAKGDLTIRFTPKSKDEIGRLGISFNRMMDKIKTLTQYDPLTALLNQYVLEKDVDTLIHSEIRQEFSLIMIAIDKFSFINETYGYKAGDTILHELAKRIMNVVAENGQVYRYKGDEFVVLCYNINADSTYDISQSILASLNQSYHVEGKIIDINVSIGVYTLDGDSAGEEPLKAVTQAKNYSKYLGGNQVSKYDIKIHHRLSEMKELQADIYHGLKEEQFFLVFQPLYYLGNENIAEIEALIRWNHPEMGLLFPDRFIDLAEQSGTIIHIDQWVIEKACRQLKKWKDTNKKQVILSINISAKTFETKKFVPNLVDTVKRYDIDPTLLQLEITERILIKNVDESIHKLNELRAMGIHVAIDDFGIGYSSLSYIVKLPIDSIKIDKSFIQNLSTSYEAKTIVSTIINLCKALKLRVVAEGIESRHELDYLKHNRCDIGQGYYFSKPVGLNEIEMKLKQKSKK